MFPSGWHSLPIKGGGLGRGSILPPWGDKRGALGVRGGRDTKPYEAISLMQEVVASAEPTPVRIAMMSFIQKLMFAFLSSSIIL